MPSFRSSWLHLSLRVSPSLSVFHPTGLQFTGTAAATTVLSQIAPLLSSINATNLVGGGDGTDIGPWMAAGVPGASLDNDNERYFWSVPNTALTAAAEPQALSTLTAHQPAHRLVGQSAQPRSTGAHAQASVRLDDADTLLRLHWSLLLCLSLCEGSTIPKATRCPSWIPATWIDAPRCGPCMRTRSRICRICCRVARAAASHMTNGRSRWQLQTKSRAAGTTLSLRAHGARAVRRRATAIVAEIVSSSSSLSKNTSNNVSSTQRSRTANAIANRKQRRANARKQKAEVSHFRLPSFGQLLRRRLHDALRTGSCRR